MLLEEEEEEEEEEGRRNKKQEAMACVKQLSRSSSSLTRCPTLKSGIDILACLEEGLHSHLSSENSIPNANFSCPRESQSYEEENPKPTSSHYSHIATEDSKSNSFHHSEENINSISSSHDIVLSTESPSLSSNSQKFEENPNSNHSHIAEEIPSADRHHSHISQENPNPQHHHNQICLQSPNYNSQHSRGYAPQVHDYNKRTKLRFLLPPLVVIIFPCLYLYSRITIPPYHRHSHSYNYNTEDLLHTEDIPSDYIALLFFFSAILISMRIAFPHLKLLYKFRALLSHSRACLAFSCLKSFHTLLPLNMNFYGKSYFTKGTRVRWTIGSTEAKESFLKKQRNKTGVRVEVYSNGDVYQGEYHHGRYCGSGLYCFYMSGSYEGDWIDGKYDGHGVETWSLGSQYCGQYKSGLRDGYGMYKFYTGDIYCGEWSHGQSHGRGVQMCSNGSRYVGEFKWGVKHGIGYYHFRNGDTYAGEYFADKMHGYGVYQFVNGHRYEGAWHEGKRQGLGMYTFRNGEIQAGHWHAGMLQTPSTQSYESHTTMAINHSKVSHVVQEARDAASKAHKLPRVNERVNKAVADANRAAIAAKIAASKAVQNKMSYSL